MTFINEGFASQIEELDRKTSSLSTVFFNGPQENGSYAGPIHLAIVGENLVRHRNNMREISRNFSLQNALYAGAAGFVNLGYIACSKASGALFFDINAYQTLFWNLSIKKMAECERSIDFRNSLDQIGSDIELAALEKCTPGLRKNFKKECLPFGDSMFKDLLQEDLPKWVHYRSKGSPDGAWMHDENLYKHIHLLAKNQALGAITLDVTSAEACEEVRRYLDEWNMGIRLLYASNILNFMQSPVRTRDFIGRNVHGNMQGDARRNLLRWMEVGGYIIECDNLSRNTPLMTHVPKPERVLRPELV